MDNFDLLGDYNILSVDYGPLAECFPYYGVAVANIKKVGPYVGQLLGFMAENLQLSANNVHLVGWSLGGQLVAFIGQEMNGTLSRITSLDPAGLYFLVFSSSRTHDEQKRSRELWPKKTLFGLLQRLSFSYCASG